MKTSPTSTRHFLELQFAFLCLSTSGVLGKSVTLTPSMTIWWRALFAAIFLGLYLKWKQVPFRFENKKQGRAIFVTGALMAVHLVTYFYSLQLSNVAVAMLSLFTFPVMTAFLEPLLLKTTLNRSQIGLGLLVLIGISFLAPTFDLQNSVTQGLLFGLLSALLYAIRNLIVKKELKSFNPYTLIFYQMVMTITLLLPILYYFNPQSVYENSPYLLALGLLTTAIGHSMFLNSFKYFSVSTASILSSIQPVYGILMAMIFLQEYPDSRSIIGGSIIILTVILESRQHFKKSSKL